MCIYFQENIIERTVIKNIIENVIEEWYYHTERALWPFYNSTEMSKRGNITPFTILWMLFARKERQKMQKKQKFTDSNEHEQMLLWTVNVNPLFVSLTKKKKKNFTTFLFSCHCLYWQSKDRECYFNAFAVQISYTIFNLDDDIYKWNILKTLWILYWITIKTMLQSLDLLSSKYTLSELGKTLTNDDGQTE